MQQYALWKTQILPQGHMPQVHSGLAAACVQIQTNYHILLFLCSCSCRTAFSLWLAVGVFQSRPSGSNVHDLEETALDRNFLNTRIKPSSHVGSPY